MCSLGPILSLVGDPLRRVWYAVTTHHLPAILVQAFLADQFGVDFVDFLALMARTRAKMPSDISSTHIFDILVDQEATMSVALQRCASGGNLFEYRFGKTYDKESLAANSHLLTKLLLANPTGVFKKSVVFDALKMYDQKLSGKLSKGSPSILRQEAYRVVHMCQVLRDVKRSSHDGSRLPHFMVELIKLLEVTPQVENINSQPKKLQNPTEAKVFEDAEDMKKSDLVPSNLHKRPILHTLSSTSSDASPPLKVNKAAHDHLLSINSTGIPEQEVPFVNSTDKAEEETSTEQQATNPDQEPSTLLCQASLEKDEEKRDIYWFDQSSQKAFKLYANGGGTAEAQQITMTNGGFTLFHFADGSSWETEVPFLCLGASGETKNKAIIHKKPAARKQAAPCPRVDVKKERKNFHSRAYHKTLCQEKQTCREEGIPYCHEKAKVLARDVAKKATFDKFGC